MRLVIGETGYVSEKCLVDFGKLFQRIGMFWLNDQFGILREDVEGRIRVRWSEERVEPVDLIFISFWCIRVEKYGEGHK